MKNHSNIKDASNGKRMERKTHKDTIMLNTQQTIIECRLI